MRYLDTHSVAVDSTGVLHIVFSHYASNALKYIAIAPDGIQSRLTLDSSAESKFWHPSIAVEDDDTVHIAYFDTFGALKYIQIDSGSASTPVILDSDRSSGFPSPSIPQAMFMWHFPM